MKKNRISNKTIALVAAALVLFAGGTFAGTRAVLNIFSPEHFLEFETDSQLVQIREVHKDGSTGTNLLSELGGKVMPGKVYDEQIRAENITKDADQYVRIIIRKYWKDNNGKAHSFGDTVNGKTVTTPDPSMIKLTMANTNLWQRNPLESTVEREVYYYKNIVPVGGVTEALTKEISVDGSVALKYTVADPDENNVIRYSYDYDGYQICLEAEAQSVQTHNAQKAVMSLWGMPNVKVSGGTLTVE